MLMLRGIGKVDLIFDELGSRARPGRSRRRRWGGIDDHFWDWTIWLAAKDRAGKRELVATELRKMHEHLLGPLGVERAPSSVWDAVEAYTAACAEAEKRLGIGVPRAVGDEVRGLLERGGYTL
jgi:hypothetical protein